MSILGTIVELSHQFGTVDYVKGGGGNTSCKSADTLWVKPSGTTLGGMTAESFVAMDRSGITRLYETAAPAEAAARETLVKDIMAAAVMPDSSGRPSVEAPLHDSFSATYVVHTHPALINGMTCGVDGREACGELFPDALWVDYIDPGYTLCMQVREAIAGYVAANGSEPSRVFLKNHGVFVAADTAEGIREIYATIMDSLTQRYGQAGIATRLPVGPAPADEQLAPLVEQIQTVVGADAAAVCVGGMFDYFDGPVTPDHIVYAKAYPLVDDPTADAIAAYAGNHGYPPRVIVAGGAVFGLGTGATRAALALELAQDGALVKQLADAFGGLDYMTSAALDFIDNWEVESYRQKQVSDD